MSDRCKNGHIYDAANTYIYPKTGRKMCRACHRDTERNRVNSNPENVRKNRERVRQWALANPDKVKWGRRNWIIDQKKIIANAKDVGCKQCGEKTHICLDFHHRDPSKKLFAIGISVGTISTKRIVSEIAKCDVLCSNCHRKLEAEKRSAKKVEG